MPPLLSAVPRRVRQDSLETSTIRDFSGGWNVIDNQLNMKSKYQPVLDNVVRGDDGSLNLRYGTEEFVDETVWVGVNPNIELIPQVEGNIHNPAGASNAGNAFNSVLNPPVGSCATGDSSELILGKEYAAARSVFAAIVYPSASGTMTSNQDTTLVATLEGSNDGIAWTAIDETPPFSSTGMDLDGFILRDTGAPNTRQGILYDGPYSFIRVNIQKVGGHGPSAVLAGEIEFYEVTAGTPSEEAGWIVEMAVFQDHIVVFFSSGQIYTIDAAKNVALIWSDEIAALLPGAPLGWSSTVDFVSYTTFGGELIACNGIDKPLLIDLTATPKVTYLQDLGTGSNANTPIARYVVALNDYVVMVGDPLFPSRVHISSAGTSGTYVGDPEPNDAVYVDLDKKVPTTNTEIRGANRFRKQLVVAFDKMSVIGTLGIYNSSGEHEPDFTDVVTGHGTISHRSMVLLGNDLLMMDHVGVPSLQRGTFTKEAEPKRTSELIDPEIQKNIGHLQVDTTTKHVHAVFNQLERQYMVFVPNHDPDDTPVDHNDDPFAVAEVGTGRLYLIFPSHHHFFPGDEVTISGATAFNVFTADQLNGDHTVVSTPDDRTNSIIEILIPDAVSTGGAGDQVGGGSNVQSIAELTETLGYVYSVVDTLKIKAWTRFRGWFWTCSAVTDLGNTLFSDGRGIYIYGTRDFPIHSDYVGAVQERAIDWAWETPWVDFEKRMNTKTTRYMALDTIGYAHFTASMFIDQLYRDDDGQLDPALQMQMEGGSTGGYGRGMQPYGGGRRTSTERLYAWTAKFKVAKLRFEGSTTEPLRFVSVSLAYRRGSIRR